LHLSPKFIFTLSSGISKRKGHIPQAYRLCCQYLKANWNPIANKWGQVWLDFERPSPIMRMLRRTTQLCRDTCSYCPVVQRWTKILEFLYYGYGTVINLSGEGHLEIGGWGYGGVSGLPKIPSMRMVRGIAD